MLKNKNQQQLCSDSHNEDTDCVLRMRFFYFFFFLSLLSVYSMVLNSFFRSFVRSFIASQKENHNPLFNSKILIFFFSFWEDEIISQISTRPKILCWPKKGMKKSVFSFASKTRGDKNKWLYSRIYSKRIPFYSFSFALLNWKWIETYTLILIYRLVILQKTRPNQEEYTHTRI